MYQVTKFDFGVDMKVLKSWLKKRDLPEELVNDLPSIGFVSSYLEHPVAMGFIRRCEGNVAILDSMITDPSKPRLVRNECLEMIMEEVLKFSRETEFKRIIGFTVEDNIIERSKRHGFEQMEHKLMTLNTGA